MQKIERTFSFERATKNTYRFHEDEDGQPPAIGNLYIQKWATGSNPPKRIKVTVEPVE